jgi:ribosome recycling factor
MKKMNQETKEKTTVVNGEKAIKIHLPPMTDEMRQQLLRESLIVHHSSNIHESSIR